MLNVTAYANPIVLARSCGGVSRCIIVRKRTITMPLPDAADHRERRGDPEVGRDAEAAPADREQRDVR